MKVETLYPIKKKNNIILIILIIISILIVISDIIFFAFFNKTKIQIIEKEEDKKIITCNRIMDDQGDFSFHFKSIYEITINDNGGIDSIVNKNQYTFDSEDKYKEIDYSQDKSCIDTYYKDGNVVCSNNINSDEWYITYIKSLENQNYECDMG